MRTGHAKQIAREWVLTEGVQLPGFTGAFHTGSVLWSDDDQALPASSDVDVMVVLTDAVPPVKLGKFRYRGLLLEVSFMDAATLASPETVLRNYHLASSLRFPCVIADVDGRLTDIQRVVARDFADPRWIRARCEQALQAVRRGITGMKDSDPVPQQVMAWLFSTGIMTHVLLVAALRNPTVRRRYVACRALLAEHDRLDYHETLLDLLGCATWTRARTTRHLAALSTVYEAAMAVDAPSYRFSSDITAAARPVSIDGSHDLVDAGLHREAVFWIVATYARCLLKLAHAEVPTAPYEPAFQDLLSDLGADSADARHRRGDRVLAALPELWNVAMTLVPSRTS